MFFRKWYWHLQPNEFCILWMHWILVGVKLAYYLKLFWSMWWLQIGMGPDLYLAKDKDYFICHFVLLLKRKLQHVAHRYIIQVTSRLLCGSCNGPNGSTGVTLFHSTLVWKTTSRQMTLLANFNTGCKEINITWLAAASIVVMI